jgi:hypothetical protein
LQKVGNLVVILKGRRQDFFVEFRNLEIGMTASNEVQSECVCEKEREICETIVLCTCICCIGCTYSMELIFFVVVSGHQVGGRTGRGSRQQDETQGGTSGTGNVLLTSGNRLVLLQKRRGATVLGHGTTATATTRVGRAIVQVVVGSVGLRDGETVVITNAAIVWRTLFDFDIVVVTAHVGRRLGRSIRRSNFTRRRRRGSRRAAWWQKSHERRYRAGCCDSDSDSDRIGDPDCKMYSVLFVVVVGWCCNSFMTMMMMMMTSSNCLITYLLACGLCVVVERNLSFV